MSRRLLSCGVGAALLCGGLLATPAQAQIDATHYTVSCDTLTKGSAKFIPPLHLGGTTTPASTKVKGTLSGCTATPDGANPAITVISGSVSGLLTNANND